MKVETKQRIEKESENAPEAHRLKSYNLTNAILWSSGYIAGATAEHKRMADEIEYLKGIIKQIERDAAREIDKYRNA